MSQDINISAKTIIMLGEMHKRLASGGLSEIELQRGLQAMFEKKEPGKSSLDQKIVATFENVGFSETYLTETIVFNGQRLKRHRNGGGWVPFEQSGTDVKKPFVAESVYVGPFAMVTDNARLFDNVEISEESRIYGNAKLHGKVQVLGRAEVYGNARVYDDAIISENAAVYGDARVYNNASIFENARIFGDAHVREHAEVYGNARVLNNADISGSASISGHAMIYQNAQIGGTARIGGEIQIGARTVIVSGSRG